MRYWKDDVVAERDRVEGELFWNQDGTYPAAKGVLLLSNGEDQMYEIEAVPGTVREEEIVDPVTFNFETGNVVDVIYRRLRDDTEGWIERKHTIALRYLGYKDSLPTEGRKLAENPAFDRAMDIL